MFWFVLFNFRVTNNSRCYNSNMRYEYLVCTYVNIPSSVKFWQGTNLMNYKFIKISSHHLNSCTGAFISMIISSSIFLRMNSSNMLYSMVLVHVLLLCCVLELLWSDWCYNMICLIVEVWNRIYFGYVDHKVSHISHVIILCIHSICICSENTWITLIYWYV